MFTKTILFAVLAACGVQANGATSPDEPDEPDKLRPGDDIQEEQHFCCHSVDPKAKTGDGCVTIGPNQIDACGEVLYCPGFWAKHDGKVFCE
jgi:hypothetical protein